MITDLIYRCPLCGCFDWFEDNGCRGCQAKVDGMSRTTLTINGQKQALAHWYDRVLGFDLVADPNGEILCSRAVRLSAEAVGGRYLGLGGIRAVHYTRRPLDTGRLVLSRDRMTFIGNGSRRSILLDSMVSLTIESNTVIVVTREDGPLFFDFLEESGKKWEDCLRQTLARHHAPRRIAEFFPRLRFDDSPKKAVPGGQCPGRVKPLETADGGREPVFVYGVVRFVGRIILKKCLPLTIEGMENIPAKGAAVMLANHSSFLDSILLEAFFPRHIWFMTKNSQYSHPLLFWFLRLARSFPVRRYTVDPQAVRNAMGIIRRGHLLGIFPEGERNWDGRMLPFKRGTMRLVLALGKPLIPVGISGAYGLMPRWTHSISRLPVTIRIGAPMAIRPIPAPAQTEADIDWITGAVRNAIGKLVEP
ncbi:MAG: 1-acyl-sn-glycerol-3-phosphate acyltransferase [Desulfobacterales bacterium]|nr:1-acyl-sn-glycerol-3-phosphate acyltransferase [Desulfobacterales bacterium]